VANDPLGCGYGSSPRTFLAGASEGGLIATLVAERQASRPDPLVAGAVAVCGPIGDFRYQLDYVADIRVAFDALFPGAIPGSAVSIPAEVVTSWRDVLEPSVRELIRAQPLETEQVLRIPPRSPSCKPSTRRAGVSTCGSRVVLRFRR
jgi:pimeloyl-ACP methyl ester carboxylesterase